MTTIISRKEARTRGLKRYFTGNPCPQGHVGDRWVSSGTCYECTRLQNPGVVKRWRAKQDPIELAAKRAQEFQQWADRNPEEYQAQIAKLNALPRDKEHYARYLADWRKRNADHVREYDRNYIATNLDKRLRTVLRTRLNNALKRNSRRGSAVRDLGCSIAEFRLHIEAQFQPGMTWANWGRGPDDWQLDHIKPLSEFDLTDRAQFLDACHFTNIRPLWSKDNRIEYWTVQILSKYPMVSG